MLSSFRAVDSMSETRLVKHIYTVAPGGYGSSSTLTNQNGERKHREENSEFEAM